MLTQEERAEVLETFLERHTAVEWKHVRRGEAQEPAGLFEHTFTRLTSRPYGELRVQVALRGDGDVDVHFFVAGHKPDWIEQVFVVPEGNEREALEEAAEFVGSFVREQTVLAYDPTFFAGGRVFLRADAVSPEQRKKLSWIVSWCGTHDWHRP